MSEPAARERSDVDFDEFERHYRQKGQPGRGHAGEDPLAELARLVGEHHDPYGDVFADQRIAQEVAGYHAYERDNRHEPIFGKHDDFSPRLSGDFASIEAGLRNAVPAHEQAHQNHDYYAQHDPHADHGYAPEQAYLQDHDAQHWAVGEMPQEPHAAEEAPAKSRRPVYAMIATIAIGVIGVGAAFAYKGSSSSPREIKTIAAASGPTKIQPPADALSPEQASQDSAMMSKGQQPAPSQVVSREEQPVDLSQAVQENASRNADAGGAPGDAANVPVPPSPSQARDAAAGGAPAPSSTPSPSDQIGSFGLSGMPASKKVKVVSVRPDGTILPNDTPPIAALPLSHSGAKPADKPSAPIAKASTPKSGDARADASSPKTTSRVASKSKPKAKVAADDTADDEAPAPKPAKKTKAKPQQVASADTATDNEPAAPAATTASRSGGFAVQLAAPGSESDAKSAASRLGKKYADALGGRKLGFRKAESNGKSVYRVRVGGMSKEEATSLCEKLKSDGGSCFVAKN